MGWGRCGARSSEQASEQASTAPTDDTERHTTWFWAIFTRPLSRTLSRTLSRALGQGMVGATKHECTKGGKAAGGLAANSGADEDNATRRRAYNCNEPRVQTTRARENGEIERCRERIMMNGRVSDGAASNGSRVSFAARTKCERRVESFSQGQGRRCDDGDEP